MKRSSRERPDGESVSELTTARLSVYLRSLEALEASGRLVGAGAPLFVVAELGLNHEGSVARALDLVDAAALAGASAIKLQSFKAGDLVASFGPSIAGRGGGKPEMAQGAGSDPSGIAAGLAAVRARVAELAG